MIYCNSHHGAISKISHGNSDIQLEKLTLYFNTILIRSSHLEMFAKKEGHSQHTVRSNGKFELADGLW